MFSGLATGRRGCSGKKVGIDLINVELNLEGGGFMMMVMEMEMVARSSSGMASCLNVDTTFWRDAVNRKMHAKGTFFARQLS